MRVIRNVDTNRYWLACPETKKLITINRTGARKVASICGVFIEDMSDVNLSRLKSEYGMMLKQTEVL